jgi:hypothetical protein
MRLSMFVFSSALIVLGAVSEVQARGFGARRSGAAIGPRGAAVGHAAGGVATGPFGGAHAGAARGGTYVGPRGTTVQHGQAGGVSRGPLGGVHAGGAQATRVTTPGGRSYTTGSRAGAGVGPAGGVHAHASSGAAVRGPYGGAAVGRGGAVAAGPFGGVAAGSYRGGVAVGAGRGVAVGHATSYVSAGALRTSAGYVRTGGGFGYSCFTPGWYRTHTAAWVAPRWRVASFWTPPVWNSLSTWCGVTVPPASYDYGSNVIIQDNNVYFGGDQVATAEEYAEQATSYADRGREARPAKDEEWQPLGVFGLIQGEEKVAQNIFQLAVNKDNIIRGNYYDAVADNTLPVYGSVNTKTQRVAWSIGDKKTVVYEAGLNNLTQEQTTVLVHYGKERTQQMILVRLEEPKEDKK